MHCPFCESTETAVTDSRHAESGDAVRRRRECEACKQRFTTYERAEGLDLKVIKKDGSQQCFDRSKIRKGLIKSTWKRPVSLEQIDQLVDQVEARLRQRQVSEIKSWEIGNLVINRLKKIDKLSYLLFASVYRDFDSLNDFKQAIYKIETKDGDSDSEED